MKIRSILQASNLGAKASQAVKLWRNYHEIMKAREQKRPPDVLPILNIEVTKACNLKCKTCAYNEMLDESAEELTLNDYKTLFRQAAEMDCMLVSLSGGEPLVKKGFIDILKAADKNGLAVHFDSNGTLLDEQTAKELANLKKLSVSLSIDHYSKTANDDWRDDGSYDGVKRSMNLLAKFAPRTNITANITLHRNNMADIGSIAALVSVWGADACKLQPFHRNLQHSCLLGSGRLEDFDLRPEDSDELKRHLENFTEVCRALKLKTNSQPYLEHIIKKSETECWTGFVSGNIDPYGNLFPCYDYRIPNPIFTRGLKNAWRSEAMQQMRTAASMCRKTCITGNSLEPAICFDTPFQLMHPLYLVSVYKHYISG